MNVKGKPRCRDGDKMPTIRDIIRQTRGQTELSICSTNSYLPGALGTLMTKPVHLICSAYHNAGKVWRNFRCAMQYEPSIQAIAFFMPTSSPISNGITKAKAFQVKHIRKKSRLTPQFGGGFGRIKGQ